jgi:predicted transcriptional regulator
MVWKMLMQKLKSSNKISDKMIDAWVQFNQLNGAKKKKNKDIAAELGISQSNVTYYCSCINNYIKKNPELSKIARHLIMLYNESLQRYYREEDNDEPVQFTIIEQNYNND